MTKPTVNDCRIISLPKVTDPRGNLTFIESGQHVPFDIRRVFYLYDVPTEESRGAHAHRTLHQFLVCLSGSFDVRVDDGECQATFHLNRPWKGLHVPPMIWGAEINFDPGSVCLVLASDKYDERDYIRDYESYVAAVAGKR
ncbi:FdtA/QdtA family cupin domain-containing protein [Caballeronia sp. LZ034LL]|uniref:sugar 3,4-ketoisomerase n=1 Tax=Caballeronia sp. LZ034LL TaxID=3038567 RepID=UPI002866DC4A|nr:FdtA/QdtA family cupin domain-containing protein [Caballeronia sp. LZ034LL]MDR5834606.1 FdtA/QdtA family cupin domain-containing protein [Caballeronia sp. LZ034LL]